MKYSIIGTGFILAPHVSAIRDTGGEIVDVVNDVHGKEAWKEMVRSTEADYIVILTPNDLHFEMAKFSLENGKKVLCEKPLAITSKDVRELSLNSNIFNVLQLRYHPLLEEIKRSLKERDNDIEMDIFVHRDEKYYTSWKGDKKRSGGLIFNLGIHYFDLLLYLLGAAKEINVFEKEERTMSGILKGDSYNCKWKISTEAGKENQHRIFKINGKDYNFSSKDNLSFENLHYFVYLDLLKGKGVTPSDVLPSVELIENIYKHV